MIGPEVTKIDDTSDPVTHFALPGDYHPCAIKESKWQKAMDNEIAAIGAY